MLTGLDGLEKAGLPISTFMLLIDPQPSGALSPLLSSGLWPVTSTLAVHWTQRPSFSSCWSLVSKVDDALRPHHHRPQRSSVYDFYSSVCDFVLNGAQVLYSALLLTWPWTNVVHYIRNRVPFQTQTVTVFSAPRFPAQVVLWVTVQWPPLTATIALYTFRFYRWFGTIVILKSFSTYK